MKNKFNLLTTLNLNYNDQRWSEFLFCLSKNLENLLINKIFIGAEINTSSKTELQRFKYLSSYSKKVFTHKITTRPTFKYLFSFCNKNPAKWILSNCDIYFPKSNADKLNLLLNKDYSAECFVLTRYNILDEMKAKKPGIDISYNGLKLRTMHGNNIPEGTSIDSWIFESPFNFSEVNFDIQLGQPQCDGMMNYQLSKIRKVSNPCLSVISIHKHLGWYPWYKKLNFNGQLMTNQQYNQMMSGKGHQYKRIKFSKLPEGDKSQT